MKLYYKQGACSLSPHIVLRELGLPFEAVKVDTKAGKTEKGADFRKINPKGYVPVLELDSGEHLTEGAVIVQYLADQAPSKKLAPAQGTLERYRLQEWLNYIATEVHKSYSPIFRAPDDAAKAFWRDALGGKLDHLQRHLSERQFVYGDSFSIADAYLFTVLRWSGSPRVGLDLARWPALAAYLERIGARPAVQAALEAENR